jgi:hypothetical protein
MYSWKKNVCQAPLFVKLQFRKCSASELVSCNETQVSETECTEACRSNYPAKRRVMRLKFRNEVHNLKVTRRNLLAELSLISRDIIPGNLLRNRLPEFALGFMPVINLEFFI